MSMLLILLFVLSPHFLSLFNTKSTFIKADNFLICWRVIVFQNSSRTDKILLHNLVSLKSGLGFLSEARCGYRLWNSSDDCNGSTETADASNCGNTDRDDCCRRVNANDGACSGWHFSCPLSSPTTRLEV
jgi:hypothetical protein